MAFGDDTYLRTRFLRVDGAGALAGEAWDSATGTTYKNLDDSVVESGLSVTTDTTIWSTGGAKVRPTAASYELSIQYYAIIRFTKDGSDVTVRIPFQKVTGTGYKVIGGVVNVRMPSKAMRVRLAE